MSLIPGSRSFQIMKERSILFFLILVLPCYLPAQQEITFIEKKGRSTFIADNPALLKPFQFHDLEISLPKNSQALSDTIKQDLQKQMEASSPSAFEYEVGLVRADTSGNVYAVSRIKNAVPDSAFAYLKAYSPGTAGEFTLRKLILDPVVLREYGFVKSSYIVRQLFVQSSKNVYEIDFLVSSIWSPEMIETYESVLSSVGFSQNDPLKGGLQ